MATSSKKPKKRAKRKTPVKTVKQVKQAKPAAKPEVSVKPVQPAAKPETSVQSVKPKRRSFYFDIGIFLFIVLILFLKVFNYSHLDANPVHWMQSVHNEYQRVSFSISELKYFGSCPNGETKIDIGQQYLCRQATKATPYLQVYDTYARNPNGKDAVYPYLFSADPALAEGLLQNRYTVPGFKTATLSYPLTWKENNYNDPKWRQNFYSLMVFKDLLYSPNHQSNPVYQQHLEAVISSFLSTGSSQPYAWSDNTTVAYRALFLANAWGELRSQDALPVTLSNAMLAAIEQHGTYLLGSQHYDSDAYLDTDEAVSLYELGVAFPTLPHANQWLSVGKSRLQSNLKAFVDSDGVLAENSPSQDLTVLQKVWDLNRYSTKFKQPIGLDLSALSDSMAAYASHIIQPNGELPIMGRSGVRKITNTNEFAEIAAHNAQFRYAISEGARGSAPTKAAVQYKTTGQTIFLSQDKGKAPEQQTQLVFNYGTTSTQYAHLDDLGFDLYGNGADLLPGSIVPSGLSPAIQQYFLSTASHNTVMVDGQDQMSGGTGTPGAFYTSPGYSYQSASDQLNPGVTHERQIITIGSKAVLVFDQLHSAFAHNYQQLFNLAPGATVTTKGLSVTEQLGGPNSSQRLTISQLSPSGISLKDSYDQQKGQVAGLCSIQVNQTQPCHRLSYGQLGSDASYVTLLQIGKPDASLNYHWDNGNLVLSLDGKTYHMNVKETGAQNITATVSSAPATSQPTPTTIDDLTNPTNWTVANGSLASSKDGPTAGTGSLLLTSNTSGPSAVMQRNINLDLTNQNILFSMKMPDTVNVNDVDLVLCSSNGSCAKEALQSTYNAVTDADQSHAATYPVSTVDNGWSQISLGKGMQRSSEGQWRFEGDGFAWNDITSVAFRIEGVSGKSVQVYLSGLKTIPAQSQGKVLITFDDGSASIMPAVNAMKADGFVGNVSVIGKYPTSNTNGYLSVSQLRMLQNDDGWSLVNHSYYHQNAITEYYNDSQLAAYTQDVLSGSAFLQDNGLNTDPNWYIYPHGATNQRLESIIGKYYKFARTELTGPEVYPFGNNLAVKTFIVENSTTPQSVESAIADANTYNQTLILTFHRIHSQSTDQSGYDLTQFEQILDYLKKNKVTVMNYNQLDQSNGVPIENLTVKEGRPSELNISVAVKSPTVVDVIKRLF